MEEKGEDEEEGRNKAEFPENLKEGNEMELGNRKEAKDHIEAIEEDEAEDMELGKLDLDKIEKESDKKGRGMFLGAKSNYSKWRL